MSNFLIPIRRYIRSLFEYHIIGMYISSRGIWVYNAKQKQFDEQFHDMVKQKERSKCAVSRLRYLRSRYKGLRRPFLISCLEIEQGINVQNYYRSMYRKIHNAGYDPYFIGDTVLAMMGAGIDFEILRKRITAFVDAEHVHVLMSFYGNIVGEVRSTFTPDQRLDDIFAHCLVSLLATIPDELPDTFAENTWFSAEELAFFADGWSKSIHDECVIISSTPSIPPIAPVREKLTVVMAERTKDACVRIGLQMVTETYTDEQAIQQLHGMMRRFQK